MEDRLIYEESAFAANLRGEEIPVDLKLNGNGKTTSLQNQIVKQVEEVEQIELKLWT